MHFFLYIALNSKYLTSQGPSRLLKKGLIKIKWKKKWDKNHKTWRTDYDNDPSIINIQLLPNKSKIATVIFIFLICHFQWETLHAYQLDNQLASLSLDIFPLSVVYLDLFPSPNVINYLKKNMGYIIITTRLFWIV